MDLEVPPGWCTFLSDETLIDWIQLRVFQNNSALLFPFSSVEIPLLIIEADNKVWMMRSGQSNHLVVEG